MKKKDNFQRSRKFSFCGESHPGNNFYSVVPETLRWWTYFHLGLFYLIVRNTMLQERTLFCCSHILGLFRAWRPLKLTCLVHTLTCQCMADTGQGSYKLSSNTKPLICCGQREDFTSTLHGMVRLKRCFTTGDLSRCSTYFLSVSFQHG